jgi:hypothetical protein
MIAAMIRMLGSVGAKRRLGDAKRKSELVNQIRA